MSRRLVAALCLGLAMGGAGAHADQPVRLLSFEDLKGWAADDHGAALSVFRETCPDLDAPEWKSVCALASQQDNSSARQFFELLFRPVLVGSGTPALFTGYYEPELQGARRPDARFRYPIYRKPPELRPGTRWHTRREIEEQGLLKGRGLEIAWLEDPVELFFLQVQGSGRIRLRDGSALRVGYGGKNGHDYRSVGQELVRRGIYRPHQVSAQVIRSWVRRNPQAGQDLLWHNPSYVFFREIGNVPADKGPLGAMNRSITAMRTVAVDPAFTPLGAPVWIEKGGGTPLHRLMVAQDTGSAIKGPQRADIFYGTGEAAGRVAGAVRDRGRMVVLLPIDRALALTGAG
ncbi:murein transglycosylase A [Rhodovulum adriaticum]|uniref:peptidoglycan lytic exotransglycosylase n=1 Tax=Rhodovulum adriaticum TaxID=35804 RepID=A0A4R2NZ06_RHOAD|nr:MltA domain-containing protein [Rhodovulum adriaticum]MBK1634877.1 murein transglycosylase [Rhodovulum adriaticum]TCP27543.1 membrane-bound lytic murein transglycosylase A [Rhodovulum adriaticum]